MKIFKDVFSGKIFLKYCFFSDFKLVMGLNNKVSSKEKYSFMIVISRGRVVL